MHLTDKGAYLESSFIPVEDGIYQVFISHPAKELGGTTRYEFIAQNRIQVGKTAAYSSIPLDTHFVFANQLLKVKDQVEIQLLRGNNPVENEEILLMSPSGWSKTYKTNNLGRFKWRLFGQVLM